MAHIAFLVANDFEQVEYTDVRKGLEAKGHRITLLSLQDKQVQGWNHNERGDTFAVDGLLKDTDLTDAAALVLPGGVMNGDNVRIDPAAQQAVRDFLNAQKPVAAICHAPWLLVSAGVVKGKQVTAYHTLKDDLVNAGGQFVDQSCVVDGGLITSRKPDDIADFVQAIDAAVG